MLWKSLAKVKHQWHSSQSAWRSTVVVANTVTWLWNWATHINDIQFLRISAMKMALQLTFLRMTMVILHHADIYAKKNHLNLYLKVQATQIWKMPNPRSPKMREKPSQKMLGNNINLLPALPQAHLQNQTANQMMMFLYFLLKVI